MSQGARKAALSQEEESLSVEAQSLHDQLEVRTLSPHGRTHCSCIIGMHACEAQSKWSKACVKGRKGSAGAQTED